jgi:hypothetical protein
MRFDEALADRPLTLGKVKVTSLADGAMKYLGLFGGGSVTLDLAVKRVLADFNHRCRSRQSKFFTHIGLGFHVGVNAAAIR